MDFQTTFAFFAVVASVSASLVVALRTISATNELESQLHKSKQQLVQTRHTQKLMEMVLRNTNDGIVIQDIEGHVEWVNPAYERLTGYSLQELHRRKPQEFVLPSEDELTDQQIKDFKYDIEGDALDSYEIVRNKRKNGELYWNQLSFAVARFDDEAEAKIIVNTRDVTEQIENEESLKRAKADIQKRAEHDLLTGLPNRLKLESFLKEKLQKSSTPETRVGILHIDLDRFKIVNDTLGHAAGDAVLTRIAEVLKSEVRKNDLPCRIGGDEFVVICPDVSGVTPLEEIAQRIHDRLEEPLLWDGRSIGMGCSIGIAMSDAKTRDPEDLIKNADIALYAVKKSGRGSIVSYNEELGRAHTERLTLSAEIKQALIRDELVVFLQPQFDLQTKKVFGFEALIRWQHPKRGLLAPFAFFPAAENNGMMADIDRVAMRGALDALRDLRDAGFDDLRMSMNVSGIMLNQVNYVDMLKWELDARGLAPDNVAIEVLETTLIESGDAKAALCIRKLSEAGFEVELDDFGTGYAGLYHLSKLDIHGVKIDRSMVADLPTDLDGQTVFGAIMRLCHELDLAVIAEGVEDTVQTQFLRDAGCKLVQGYGVARPMPAADAADWLKSTDMATILSTDANTSLELQRA